MEVGYKGILGKLKIGPQTQSTHDVLLPDWQSFLNQLVHWAATYCHMLVTKHRVWIGNWIY
jgi:hypothetical protein